MVPLPSKQSAKAYKSMCSARFIKLPIQRTLYTDAILAKFGFQDNYVSHMMEEARKRGMYEEEWWKYVGLLRDEVHLQEGLMYDKSGAKLTGYIDLDKFGNELMHLEWIALAHDQPL